MPGGDAAVIAAHDAAVRRIDWLEASTIQTRMKEPESGMLVHTGGQKMVAATFRHEVSRNLAASQPRGSCQHGAGGRRQMAHDVERVPVPAPETDRHGVQERAGAGLEELGHRVEKTHADGRFEIAGVPRSAIDAFSTRRAEIEASMAERGLGDPASNPHLAERAALMTRARKRDVDREALHGNWREQAASLGFSADAVIEAARQRCTVGAEMPKRAAERSAEDPVHEDRSAEREPSADVASQAVSWAMEHLSEREAVFAQSDLLAAALAWKPGAVSVEAAGTAIDAARQEGRLHAAPAFRDGEGLTTDTALADERETIGLMRSGQDRGQVLMRRRKAQQHLHKGPLTDGQKQAVTVILSSRNRVVGVQGYAGSGKTAMLDRARALAEKSGYSVQTPKALSTW